MAAIRKRGGKWHAQVRRIGCRPLTRSFINRADALAWSRLVEAEIDRFGLSPDRKVLDRATLADVLRRYRDTVVVAKRSREIESIILDALIRTDMAKLPIRRLTSKVVAEYRDARSRRVKAVTINRELGLMQHALDIAQREWDLPLLENPLRKVRKLPLGSPRERRLRADEADRITIAAAQCRNRHIEPLVCFAIETGMRQGELLRAAWSHLSINDRVLRIPVTKNGQPRIIPLSKTALDILGRLNAARDVAEPRIFPTTERAVKLAWRRLVRRAGIEDLHFHDLRHEAISRFFEMGLNVPEVALISGHRDPRMLFRYTHPRAETIAEKLRHL